jgi:hypothetical protein
MLRARREHPVEEVEAQSSTVGLSEEVEQRAELRELLSDLERLPERQKSALVLSEVGALYHAQVAQVLDCETKQVKSLVFQARSALVENRRAREIPCTEIREQLATASAGSCGVDCCESTCASARAVRSSARTSEASAGCSRWRSRWYRRWASKRAHSPQQGSGAVVPPEAEV